MIQQVPSLHGYYAGTDGIIYSSKGRAGHRKDYNKQPIKWGGVELYELLQMVGSRGYSVVPVSVNGKKGTKTVHRLVLEAHTGECPKGMQGCHGPTGRQDNNLSNLRWASVSENNKEDKIRDGVHKVGDKNPAAKLRNEDIDVIRRRLNIGEPLQAIANDYSVSRQTMWRIKHRRSWSTIGDSE